MQGAKCRTALAKCYRQQKLSPTGERQSRQPSRPDRQHTDAAFLQ